MVSFELNFAANGGTFVNKLSRYKGTMYCFRILYTIFIISYIIYSYQGATLTSLAFADSISWFPMVLTVAIFLFAVSTMISWSYYGQQAWMYLFGRSKTMEMTYKVLFLLFIILIYIFCYFLLFFCTILTF